jgi:hypothetical protein
MPITAAYFRNVGFWNFSLVDQEYAGISAVMFINVQSEDADEAGNLDLTLNLPLAAFLTTWYISNEVRGVDRMLLGRHRYL